jgi:probable HAF family extracellular repeat protein
VPLGAANVTQGRQTINLLGDVIGESDTAYLRTHAFLWHAGKCSAIAISDRQNLGTYWAQQPAGVRWS